MAERVRMVLFLYLGGVPVRALASCRSCGRLNVARPITWATRCKVCGQPVRARAATTRRSPSAFR
jgi:hypothetical protein